MAKRMLLEHMNDVSIFKRTISTSSSDEDASFPVPTSVDDNSSESDDESEISRFASLASIMSLDDSCAFLDLASDFGDFGFEDEQRLLVQRHRPGMWKLFRQISHVQTRNEIHYSYVCMYTKFPTLPAPQTLLWYAIMDVR
jgi:hypothetical protein